MKQLLLLPSLIIFSLPVYSSSELVEKAYSSSVLGAHLCNYRLGKITKQVVVENSERLVLKKGYKSTHLYDPKVRKAAKYIASELGANCEDNGMSTNQNVLQKVMRILNE